MKRFGLLLLLVGAFGASRVIAGPEEDYLAAYQFLEEADTLEASNSTLQARNRYADIQARLLKIKEAYPTWNQRTVDFRLQYVSEKLKKLGGPVPQAQQPAAKPAVKPAPAAAPVDPTAELRAN